MPDPKDKQDQIEIETPVTPEPEPMPTESEAKDSGLSAKEIEAAKEHGLLAKEGGDEKTDDSDKTDPDNERNADRVGSDNEPADKKDGEANGKEKEGEEKGTAADILDKELGPEEERQALSKFNKNEYALYWRLKKEKVKRQSSEADRDHTLIKLKAKEKEAEDLKARLDALEKQKKIVTNGDEDDLGLDDTAAAEPKDKPLTEKDLDEREKRKEEEAKKEQESRREKARKLSEAHKTLEVDAKSRYTDFDSAAELANEIVKASSEGRLNEIFPDPRTASKINRKVKELLAGLVRADEFQDGEYNPADIAYELGTSHPKYGKPSSTTNGKSGKDQALSPEEVDRLARRRTPSAAISGGGGRRLVSFDDLTVEDAARLTDDAFRKLPKEVRTRLLNA